MAASPEVDRRRLRRLAAFVLLFVLLALALFASTQLYEAAGVERGRYDYNIAAWEARNFANKWLFAFGELFRHAPSGEEQDAGLLRFFELTREIDGLEGAAPSDDDGGSGAFAAKLTERRRLENRVEATIESRLSRVIEQQGLGSSLFIAHTVWPPVDFELTRAPQTLAVSPRDRIELKASKLLREEFSLAQIEKIEEETERNENVSAVAFPAGGVGAYPTIVEYPASYREALEVIAHEWMHNYLSFHPLGFNYYKNNDLRTINETVADLAGKELAEAVLASWPLPEAPQPAPEAPPQPVADVGVELRRLRGEVDALLADGKITEAEELMEQRRRQLAARGVYIRKINQAYFAFTNLYAGASGSPGATNPIGPKIDELRRRSLSLAQFVRAVRGITSIEGLDRAVAERE